MDLPALVGEGTEVSAVSGDLTSTGSGHLSGMSDDGNSANQKPPGSTDTTKLGIKKRKTVACESEKPHFCPKCFSTFQSKFNLRMHTRAVHEHDKAYECDQCSYAARQKGPCAGTCGWSTYMSDHTVVPNVENALLPNHVFFAT
eukprot:CAMPEP_0184741190 /NCGR_PEP_ID=MMETSP0315-20130426/4260_1 /TAXON_ID=101924 /ORGANISM="Rhodosorus marinus, Strain UTEX LB 2760" /LENGTH=143 /DNA_ID=CAMNT_0027211371 /DNA_START=471 /DNA_END=903 /DNA_ORIENTATION=+